MLCTAAAVAAAALLAADLPLPGLLLHLQDVLGLWLTYETFAACHKHRNAWIEAAGYLEKAFPCLSTLHIAWMERPLHNTCRLLTIQTLFHHITVHKPSFGAVPRSSRVPNPPRRMLRAPTTNITILTVISLPRRRLWLLARAARAQRHRPPEVDLAKRPSYTGDTFNIVVAWNISHITNDAEGVKHAFVVVHQDITRRRSCSTLARIGSLPGCEWHIRS